MANHKSAVKRIRSNERKRLRNRFQHKTARNAVRKLRASTSKKEAKKLFLGLFLWLTNSPRKTSFMPIKPQI